jgi:hypothetical protein
MLKTRTITAGFVALSAVAVFAGTATAQPGFKNCDEARAAGVENIPVSDPRYSTDLDRNNDGVACESGDRESSQTGTRAPRPGTVRDSLPVTH